MVSVASDVKSNPANEPEIFFRFCGRLADRWFYPVLPIGASGLPRAADGATTLSLAQAAGVTGATKAELAEVYERFVRDILSEEDQRGIAGHIARAWTCEACGQGDRDLMRLCPGCVSELAERDRGRAKIRIELGAGGSVRSAVLALPMEVVGPALASRPRMPAEVDVPAWWEGPGVSLGDQSFGGDDAPAHGGAVIAYASRFGVAYPIGTIAVVDDEPHQAAQSVQRIIREPACLDELADGLRIRDLRDEGRFVPAEGSEWWHDHDLRVVIHEAAGVHSMVCIERESGGIRVIAGTLAIVWPDFTRRAGELAEKIAVNPAILRGLNDPNVFSPVS